MLDLTQLENFVTVVTTVLVAVQAVVNYVLPPEKASKFNVVGNVLNFLVKTKAGLSTKVD